METEGPALSSGEVGEQPDQLPSEYRIERRAGMEKTKNVRKRGLTLSCLHSLSLQGAGGVGGLLSQIHNDSSGSQTFHYTYDLNGNVSEVLDSSGSIAAHYEYGPFGEVLVQSYTLALSPVEGTGLGTAVASFRFSTKYYDTELKTYYYGYRYYDPTNGRWPSRDPLEEDEGANLYGFVGNDGVNWWDLLGEKKYRQFIPPDQQGSTMRAPMNKGKYELPLPNPEMATGSPSTTMGGIAGAIDIMAGIVSDITPSRLINEGLAQCDSKVPYNPLRAFRGCCCCVVQIHLFVDIANGRYNPIAGLPSSGYVQLGNCSNIKAFDEMNGIISPIHWKKTSAIRQFMHNVFNIPLPMIMPQRHLTFYEDWGCS